MKIKTILSQNRRDLRAVYECEHCGYEVDGVGYDDKNFHENVISSWSCKKCLKTAANDYVPREPKYPEWMIV